MPLLKPTEVLKIKKSKGACKDKDKFKKKKRSGKFGEII
jgi:hypothetical protein